MRSVIPIILLMTILTSANAQENNEYKADKFIEGTDTLLYRILMPENFDPAKKYPVLLFLHGAGERGNDNEIQLTHGSKLFLQPEVRRNFPAIVIFPQCPSTSYWSNVKSSNIEGKRSFDFATSGKPTKAMKLLINLMETVKDLPYTDNNRFYSAGLSMGGMGTFEIIRRMRGDFAAAIAICGGDNPKNVKKYKNVPLWIFHGAKDDVVVPENSQIVVDALKAKGADVKFTLYPEANHNSWDLAFAEPELLSWLFSHHKK
ncbi:MAG: prolyl oligopeptidase family serine peptidase [Flavobacterium sp.]|nr:prolyl oligopeptidase family serine peptidase [Pedobacter sp.]